VEKVTISILSFNGKEVLKKCIESCLAQTYKPDEILVVDNHSEDGAYELAKSYPEVTTYQTYINQGYIHGVNMCFKESRNDLVLHMSHDVILEENALLELMDLDWDEHDIAQPRVYNLNGEVDNLGMKYVWPGYGMAIKEPKWTHQVMKVPYQGMCTFMAKKSYIEKCGGFDPTYYPAFYEDVDFYLRNKPRTVVSRNARATHRGSYTFSTYYKKKEISGFCRDHRKRIVKTYFNFFDAFIRLTAMYFIDVLNHVYLFANMIASALSNRKKMGSSELS